MARPVIHDNMTLPDSDDLQAFLDVAPSALVLIALAVLLLNAFLNRDMPRVGGKIGRRHPGVPADPPPEGFSRVVCRHIVTYSAPAEPERYTTLKRYMREGTQRQPGLLHIYYVAGCKTRIEIPAAMPSYDRIEPAEALALLRELPDPRLVWRLHLSDEPAFLDPWWRRVSGRRDIYHLGNATNLGLVVLYRPDRALGRELGTTLLHEWVHLLAFNSQRAVRRFRRANRIETLPALPIAPVQHTDRKLLLYETWADLGEKLLGYDEAFARHAAMVAPVHAMILWRCIEKALRKVPKLLASTRTAEFAARAAFMHAEVAPQARAARLRRRWWRRLYASVSGTASEQP